MRFRLPLGRSVFFISAFLFALVALLPLRLALDWLTLDERGFAAREAKGSIWLGGLSEAQLGPVPLGDLQAGLRTLPLFLGRARVDLKRGGDEDPLRASATVSRHAFGIDDASARLATGALFGPLPLVALDLDDLSVRFDDGLCARADGLVKATLAEDLGGLVLAGGLSGTARCEQGALLLPLRSQTGLEALSIRLFEDGRYRVELVARPSDEAARARLAAIGFVPTSAGYALAAGGTLAR